MLQRSTLFELAWILPSIALPFGMLVAIMVTAFGAGIHVPSHEGRVDPRRLAETPPFDRPGLVETAPGEYEVRLVARTWAFDPQEVRVPAGSRVTFVATSQDVVHGLLVPGRNVNVMLIPGQVARVMIDLPEPGELVYVCHEYCGVAHHTMWGRLIVEPTAQAASGETRHEG
jgi:cytochrome c oxidase subunit 2